MVGEGVEPCNILPFGKSRYRCDHQPFAKIKSKVEYSKYKALEKWNYQNI